MYVLGKALPHDVPRQTGPASSDRASFSVFSAKAGVTVALSINALADTDDYGSDELSPDWGLCQSAPSEFQGLEYVSNLKRCLSPITGEKICLTS